jgi:hypothetical protein
MALLDLALHVSQRVLALREPQQSEQVWAGIFQGRIKCDEAAIYFFAALMAVIAYLDVEIAAQ